MNTTMKRHILGTKPAENKKALKWTNGTVDQTRANNLIYKRICTLNEHFKRLIIIVINEGDEEGRIFDVVKGAAVLSELDEELF